MRKYLEETDKIQNGFKNNLDQKTASNNQHTVSCLDEQKIFVIFILFSLFRQNLYILHVFQLIFINTFFYFLRALKFAYCFSCKFSYKFLDVIHITNKRFSNKRNKKQDT